MATATKPHADINAIRETIEAVRKEPGLGKVTFTMKSQSKGRLALETQTGPLYQNGEADVSRMGKFTLISDEPVSLLGGDTGVSPAEYALKALAGCYAVTLASMAASREIELDGLQLNLAFDIDLNGFLGLDANVRKGAKAIRVDVKLDSNSATREQLEELVRELPCQSPLHDTFANPVPVSASLL